MRVLLVTTGSRGDVEPFAALAEAMAAVGLTPTLAAPARFRALTAHPDVHFVGLDDSALDLQESLAHGGFTSALSGVSKAKKAVTRFLTDVAGLAEYSTDAIVYHPKTLAAPSLAEYHKVPSIAAQLLPLYQPTSAFPAPVLSRRLPNCANRTSWHLVPLIERPWRSVLRRLRVETLGLTTPVPTISQQVREHGSLNAWSEHLLPRPKEWPPHAAPIGFWYRATAERPSQRVVDFVNDGDPPIYVGFGSMMARESARMGTVVRDALRMAGRRAIVATGAGAIHLRDAADILVVDQVDHGWLFPRVSAVVHHGGVGTVGAAMRAGVPQVIRPFIGDQSFWSRRVEEIGIGTSVARPTPDALARAILAAEDLRHKARVIGEQTRSERGLTTAIDRIVAMQQ